MTTREHLRAKVIFSVEIQTELQTEHIYLTGSEELLTGSEEFLIGSANLQYSSGDLQ